MFAFASQIPIKNSYRGSYSNAFESDEIIETISLSRKAKIWSLYGDNH